MNLPYFDRHPHVISGHTRTLRLVIPAGMPAPLILPGKPHNRCHPDNYGHHVIWCGGNGLPAIFSGMYDRLLVYYTR